MSKPLPPNPTLEYDKKQAKALLKAYKAGDADALERVRAAHPRLENVPERQIPVQEFKLSDAQLVIAREYGFSSWPKLKHEIELVNTGLAQQFSQFADAVKHGRTTKVKELLASTPGLVKMINDPVINFDAPAILVASEHSKELVDVLLGYGADINTRSVWWAGGFSALHGRDRKMFDFLVERGAKLDAYAATEQNLLAELRALVEADPDVVHAKGPDGQRPLHFARSKTAIDYLLEHGADINARDVDHRGTAAQWLLGDHPDLSRYLLERGAESDIFMVCALGDMVRVKELLASDPQALERRIGQDGYPPVPRAPGSHIYLYSLGNGKSPMQVAQKYGHTALYQYLLEQGSPQRRFVAACERGDVTTVDQMLKENPSIAASLPPSDQQLIVDAAWNNNLRAVEVMLKAGFDPHVQNTGDQLSPLLFTASAA